MALARISGNEIYKAIPHLRLQNVRNAGTLEPDKAHTLTLRMRTTSPAPCIFGILSSGQKMLTLIPWGPEREESIISRQHLKSGKYISNAVEVSARRGIHYLDLLFAEEVDSP
jgi:hypothetical protein